MKSAGLLSFLLCSFIPVVGAAAAPTSDLPRVVPTFNYLGLYWRTPHGAPDLACAVSYRAAGESDWRVAQPLWFDATDHAGQAGRSHEYRGSIVGLTPDTAYEVKLSLPEPHAERLLTVRTRNDRFKIARTITLPDRIEGTYVVRDGGSDAEGYVLYTSPPDRRTHIDGRGEDDVNIRIDASHVIVRGLDLQGARRHGIDLGPVTDVVIEDCDISGWGENLDDGWGRNFDSAIHHATPDDAPRTLRRIVIQNNRLHHPRSNSNSWLQPRTSRNGSRHPVGPQAISFINADGEIVIRHNEIFSDFDHMFNDAMGEYHNFGYAGFPGRDSDIYGNRVSHCWDDGLEIEGANMNVRVWANVIDWTFIGIGGATTSLGPCYIFRNVYLHSRRGPGANTESYKGQTFLKLGADPKNADFARGRLYVFHNTVLQPPAWSGFAANSGATRGLHLTGRDKHQANIVSRNNLFWLRDENGTAIYDGQKSPLNDFDHDLFNGGIDAGADSEVNGLRATPAFGAALDAARAWTLPLAAGTAGHDRALRLPNFNDDFAGAGPDIGAFETGGSVTADFPASTTRAADIAPPRDITVRRDVAFLSSDRAERLDLYLPPGHTPFARRPAVVWIHGGGWNSGNKTARREKNVCTTLAAAGFVCASIDYKLGAGSWPQNLLDAKNAVRYVRAHAAELGVDPERIAVAGGSAGAHLALMVAYTAGVSELEPASPYPDVPSTVRCVIDFYGLANLLTRRETTDAGVLTDQPKLGGPLAVFGATSANDPVFRLASPVSHIGPQSPPTLILHGLADATVDYAQSEELARTLAQQGVAHDLVLLEGVGHTFDFAGWKDRPLPRDARAIVIEFLNRHLK